MKLRDRPFRRRDNSLRHHVDAGAKSIKAAAVAIVDGTSNALATIRKEGLSLVAQACPSALGPRCWRLQDLEVEVGANRPTELDL